jgi:predicted nucleic acid-binding protein
MALWFLDTSAVVKLYARELGSERLIDGLAGDRRRCAILALTRVECRAALRRRQRTGEYPQGAVDLLLERFARDMSEYFLVQPIDESVFNEAERLLDRVTLRAYDALQLAGCLRLGRERPAEELLFVCSDAALGRAAAGEGLRVYDPERNESAS